MVNTCKFPFPKPEDDALFQDNGFSVNTEIVQGSEVFYNCKDGEAILSDGQRQNFFKAVCGAYNDTFNTLGVAKEDGTIDFDFEFPKCQSECKVKSVGSLLFTPENTTDEFRTGDSLKFFCPEHYFVVGQEHTVNSIVSTCQPDGQFKSAFALGKRCEKIPCTQEDIDRITAQTKGEMKTKSEGEIAVGDSIFYLCSDPLKVPTNGDPGNWSPMCLGWQLLRATVAPRTWRLDRRSHVCQHLHQLSQSPSNEAKVDSARPSETQSGVRVQEQAKDPR